MFRISLLTLAIVAMLASGLCAQAPENAAPVGEGCQECAPLCRLPRCPDEPRVVRFGAPRCVAEPTKTACYPVGSRGVVGERHCLTIGAMRQALKPAAAEKTVITKAAPKNLRITTPPAPICNAPAKPIVRKQEAISQPAQVILLVSPCPTCSKCAADKAVQARVECVQPKTATTACTACTKCNNSCEKPQRMMPCPCDAAPKCVACPRVAAQPGDFHVSPPVIRFGVSVPESNVPIRSLPDEVPTSSPRRVPSGLQGQLGEVRFDAVPVPVSMPPITTAASTSARTVTGQVAHFRKNWHLRYSGVEFEDEFGGSVVLSGAGLEQLQDGQVVRVSGVITPSLTRGETAVLEVQTIELLGVSR